jgi:ADP-heptose:LPS heptosyltransferase
LIDAGVGTHLTVFEHPAALAGAPVNWPALRRILVVRPDNLGDVLLTGPALTSLRAAAPHARIDLLASPGGATAAALLPEIDGTVVAKVSWQQIDGPTGQDPDPDADLVAELAGRGYEAAVLLTSFSQSPWPAAEICRRAGIPVRAGMSKEFGGTALTHWVPAPDDALHQVDRALHLLERLAVPAAARTLHAAVPAAGRSHARATLADLGLPTGPYAVLLPGASCPSRRYPGFREVAAGLAARLPVIVSGPAAEEELVASVADGSAGVHPLPGALDVPGLAGLLASAAVAVTNNSGGMHLADAVGTPVTVLFAGTEEVGQYRPRSVPAAVLGRPVSCSPCRQFRCPFALECLDVPPAEVVAAALDLAGPRFAEVSGVESRGVGIPVP